MDRIKTIAIFEDISGVGRCALSVAIPVISFLGCQACPVPTALLSGHTGFGGVTPFDATLFVSRAISEWAAIGRRFDGVMSGYMPSPACVQTVTPFIKEQRLNGRFTLVDPAMADNGKLYRSLDPSIVDSYKKLIRYASIITPNETEARMLAGFPIRDTRSLSELGDLMDALLDLGCESAVITGWAMDRGLSANAFKRRGGELALCEYAPLDAHFPGAGDILASCLAGYSLSGMDTLEALRLGTAFVRRAMEITIDSKTEPREGILIEKVLRMLL